MRSVVSEMNSYVRDRHVLRRRPLADAAGGVVFRAVARAEPAAVLALLAERHAAEMGADLDHDEPASLPLAARFSSVAGALAGRLALRASWSRSSASGTALASSISFGRALAHDHRLAAPLDDQRHALGHRRDVDLDLGERQRRGVRVHLVDQRPDGQRRADRADGTGRDVEEIAPCRLRMVSRIGTCQDRTPKNAPPGGRTV